MPRRPTRVQTRLFGVVVGFVLVASACSQGDEAAEVEAPDEFCDRAEEYLRFEPSLGRAANDPEQMQVFVSAWQSRLDALEDRAPDEVRDDVIIIKASVDELDEELATVGYDLLSLSIEQLDGLDALADGDGSDADRRFRGYVDANCTVAPSPLTDDELAELVGGDDEVDVEGEVTAAMAEDLEVLLGISPEASDCLASNLEPNVLDELLAGVDIGGGEMSEETIDALIGVIDLCGITAEDLIG